MEDDYGFTWGFHETMTPWFGSPYYEIKPIENPVYPNSIFAYTTNTVAFRFMGPDPISFCSSMSMKLGTRPDYTETVIYYYKKQGTDKPQVKIIDKWKVTGTIPCKTKEEFEQPLPEGLISVWDDSVQIDSNIFKVHELNSDHTWVNFHPIYFTSAWTPFALTGQAVFAKGNLNSIKTGKQKLVLAFDDWIGVWINGELSGYYYHDTDFMVREIQVDLKKGRNEILIKSVNFDSIPNNRLWALSLRLEA